MAASLVVRARRYLLILGRFWTASLAAELEYQANVVIELLAVIANLAGSLFTLSLFYGHGHDLGGWSWDAALVVLGLYTLLDGLTTTLLQPNLSTIVTHVRTGTLDFVLLKPVDSQFWLSTRTISPWGLPGLIAGAVLAMVAAVRAGAPLDPLSLSTAALLLIASALILYSLWFVLAATSIWFVKVWNATEVLRSALVAGRYPVSAYPAGLRLFFTVVLPVAFLTTVPAEAILGRASLAWLLLSLAVAALSLLISRRFWSFALRFYTSASS
ncbi:ABC-2 family transporter protein [Synechococcus sp. CS-1325]|uniref:ABC transporter permease n=1 Tax=unclassified Synechococcus TaxID=2626047 RepID=UPI000DB62F64|nr:MULTISPECIES: ABC-2 family transporter protein [unclassified Synechococcus]MCT0199463.1 ABC-2 family transporter protein [Synechococcus sp. CS-1325]MCT0214524.1 ABC-2 family transporter protein [Synechococcus sp. CS-1326]MCT0233173.1 ABC-2 family transporter protein [Synechococcus sp. CS-1327]PZV03065.1 MAG: ABC transporter permease [Cyanobium sp.]